MKKTFGLSALWLCLVLAPAAGIAQGLRIVHAAALSNHVAALSWSRADSVSEYGIFRRFPSQTAFVLLAAVPDTHYVDTLHRVFCADTVSYFVCAFALGGDTVQSDTVGILFRDDLPTASPTLDLCSVDTLLRRVRLSWHPSPDTDVLGYCICRGTMDGPCFSYDTVWGRTDTTYLFPEPADSADSPNRFRVLAFDSCFSASPLTPYCHYLVLNFTPFNCSRRLLAEWNSYDNMPDSVRCYRFYYRLPGDTLFRCHSVVPSAPLQFDTVVADLDVVSVYAYVCVENRTGTLQSFSLPRTYRFPYGDTAAYLRLDEARYDTAAMAVRLTVSVAPDYGGSTVTLYRRCGRDTALVPLAVIDRLGQQWNTFEYVDSSLTTNPDTVTYRLGAADLCGQRETFSDTLGVVVPELPDPTAWIPNAIIFGDPACGHFCPRFLSPLAAGYNMAIFDRRGECLFRTTDYQACWDGTVHGQALPQGVYVYRIRCHHADGSVWQYVGTITLIK